MNREYLEAFHPDVMTMDGFDDCILGICERINQESIVAYDLQKVLAKLQKQGMTEEEAIEWHEYNQLGAWVGESTPCFIDRREM